MHYKDTAIGAPTGCCPVKAQVRHCQGRRLGMVRQQAVHAG